ncbi:MAG: 4Fe-4S dicluster domain-containing protein [Lachnospiraceae bacterium]|jgi:anaerobic dimethyl sulfoxide reductase subunit B (iron-sulfur subunit)
MRVVCDNEKCTGCLACVVTCLDHHYPEGDANAAPLRIHRKTVYPSGYTGYVTESCHHCENAPCAAACPAGAVSRRQDGLIMVDKELCIGCGACKQACPFDIPRFDAEGKMVKCDGCGGDPACVKICPNKALRVE